jgi:succinylglutamate desuccinylase
LGALAANRRYLERDLNRLWSEPRLTRLAAGGTPENAEERELAELEGAVGGAIAAAPGRVFLLDLHTTSGGGPAFAVLDDALPNRRFALGFPAPLVLGLEEELFGTMVFYWTARGVTCVAFEAGQHADPAAVDRSEAAIWLARAATGLLPPALLPRAEAARRLLRANRGTAPHLVEVTYRHRIAPADLFRMNPGYRSFDRVRAGQALATDRDGTVVASMGGRLLMPLYQPQGEDGFFLAKRVARFWFELSAIVRRLRVDRLLPHLPGIHWHPELADTLVVNRIVARWAVRELFHLLGYKRLEKKRWRVLYRRRADSRE